MKPYPDHPDPDPFSEDPAARITAYCERARDRYEDGESVALIEAHWICVRAGYTPPDWVLEGLRDVFAECIWSRGETSIDAQLGLKSSGRGKQHPLKARSVKRRRAHRAKFLHRIVAALGVTPMEAAYMVQCKEEAEGVRDVPDADWIAEDYRRNWRDHFEPMDEVSEAWANDKEGLLSAFPESCRPAGLK